MPFATRKSYALFAFLAVSGKPIRREVLREMLWGDVLPAQGRHSLRQAITHMKAALRQHDDRILSVDRDSLAVDGTRVRTDVRAVERLLARGTPASIRIACGLARGDFLADVDVREAGLERWLMLERVRVRQLVLDAHEQHIGDLELRGDYREALRLALRVVEIDPLHEWGHRAVMRAHHHLHQFGAALRYYEQCARMLSEQIRVDPDAETRELLGALRREAKMH